jgi:hypothetical protein
MFEVTFWPILAAAVLNVVLGMIWFHPKVFGTAFMANVPMTPEMKEKGGRRMMLSAFLAFLAAMVVAYVMNYFGIAWGVFDWVGAIELGFWCWIGFTAPPMLGMILWEMKPIKHYAIIAGFWLLSFIAMEVTLVLMA